MKTDSVARVAPATRRWLLANARDALAKALQTPAPPLPPAPDDPILDEPARMFVSWHEGTRLVGCIGVLEPRETVREGTRRLAVQSGLHDHRTPMPAATDLPRLHAEISILTPPEPMAERGLAEIAAALVPGRDGLVLHDGAKRAVFLPVVWNSLTTPAAFVTALCRKAGIDPQVRAEHVRGERFFAEEFSEPH
ncbi:MAG: AmmeMemoRadiSam system protein A [Myxococcota bacterium]